MKNIVFLLVITLSPQLSFAGPSFDTEKDFNAERLQSLQTVHSGKYRFDITKPPVYSNKSDVYLAVENGEGCPGDSSILVTDEKDEIVFFKRIYVPTRFIDLNNTKYNVRQDVKTDVIIMQHSGGGSCCEYLHIFQTKPVFKYLGKQDAYLK